MLRRILEHDAVRLTNDDLVWFCYAEEPASSGSGLPQSYASTEPSPQCDPVNPHLNATLAGLRILVVLFLVIVSDKR